MMEFHQEGWYICNDHCGKKFKNEKLFDAHLNRIDIQFQKYNNQIFDF